MTILAAAGVVVQESRQRPAGHIASANPLVVVDTQRSSGTTVSPLLFGLGVDLPAATYHRPADRSCLALAGADAAATLVRVGASTADDYDWQTDTYVTSRPGHPLPASFPCPIRADRAGATVLRVLDRVFALHAAAVVVLNGEVDDPQSAAGLVRLIVRRYGLAFARQLYWEIGNDPASWQHFGIPLADRSGDDNTACLPDQYAAVVTSYAIAVRAALAGTDPRIVAGEWISNATDQSWTDVVHAVDTAYYPFNSPYPQPTSAVQVAGGVFDAPRPAAVPLDQRLFSLRANLKQYNGATGVPLFVGAWNADANSSVANPANQLYAASNAQAVFAASLLVHLARDGVAMAAWAPPLYTSAQAPFTLGGAPTPGFRVFSALRVLGGARLLTAAAGAAPSRLDILAARLSDGRTVVALVNTSGRDAVLRLRFADMRKPGTAEMQEFTPATPDGQITHLSPAGVDMPLRVDALSVVLITSSA